MADFMWPRVTIVSYLDAKGGGGEANVLDSFNRDAYISGANIVNFWKKTRIIIFGCTIVIS